MDAIWVVMIAVFATLLSILVGRRMQASTASRRTLLVTAVLGLVVLAGVVAFLLLR